MSLPVEMIKIQGLKPNPGRLSKRRLIPWLQVIRSISRRGFTCLYKPDCFFNLDNTIDPFSIVFHATLVQRDCNSLSQTAMPLHHVFNIPRKTAHYFPLKIALILICSTKPRICSRYRSEAQKTVAKRVVGAILRRRHIHRYVEE